jgi:hypothetical protein
MPPLEQITLVGFILGGKAGTGTDEKYFIFQIK